MKSIPRKLNDLYEMDPTKARNIISELSQSQELPAKINQKLSESGELYINKFNENDRNIKIKEVNSLVKNELEDFIKSVVFSVEFIMFSRFGEFSIKRVKDRSPEIFYGFSSLVKKVKNEILLNFSKIKLRKPYEIKKFFEQKRLKTIDSLRYLNDQLSFDYYGITGDLAEASLFAGIPVSFSSSEIEKFNYFKSHSKQKTSKTKKINQKEIINPFIEKENSYLGFYFLIAILIYILIPDF